MGTRFSALGKAPRRMSALLGRLRSFDGPSGNRLPGPPRPLDRLAVKVLLLLFEQREARVIFRHYPRLGYCNRLQRQKRASVAIRSTGIFYPIRGAIARPRRKVASRLGAFHRRPRSSRRSSPACRPHRRPHKMLRGPSSDAPLELVNGSRDFGDWHFGHSVPPVLSRPRRQPPRAALPADLANLYYC